MEFVFWFEDLDVERAVWSEVFGSPCPQNSLVILWEEELLYLTHALTHFTSNLDLKGGFLSDTMAALAESKYHVNTSKSANLWRK